MHVHTLDSHHLAPPLNALIASWIVEGETKKQSDSCTTVHLVYLSALKNERVLILNPN